MCLLGGGGELRLHRDVIHIFPAIHLHVHPFHKLHTQTNTNPSVTWNEMQPTRKPTKRATDSEGGVRKTHGRVHVAHALCNGVGHDHFHPAVLPTSRAADVEVIPGQVHGAPHPDVQLPGLRHQAAVRRAQDGQEQQPAVPPGRPIPARRRS